MFKVWDIRFDYDFEAFFAEGDEATEFLAEHRQRFETDNDFVFISLERGDQSVFDHDFLLKTDALIKTIAADSLVESVQCLTNMEDFFKTPFSPKSILSPIFIWMIQQN